MTRENSIANNALDRVQAISDQSLTRLQEIESDAFDRIDSALQDGVPVAASQVAHEFVIAALVVACIVALFGFAGISLWKNLQQAREGELGMPQILKNGFRSFWRTLPQEAAVVVIPTVLIAAAILAGYEGYLRSTQAMRVARLEKAAGLLSRPASIKWPVSCAEECWALTEEPTATANNFHIRPTYGWRILPRSTRWM